MADGQSTVNPFQIGQRVELRVDHRTWFQLCINAGVVDLGQPVMAVTDKARPGTCAHCNVLEVWDHRKVVVRVFAIVEGVINT